MSPEEIRQHREAIAYVKDVKELIITDARALYAIRGLTHHTITFDVITSTYGGAYQATLIYYHNRADSNAWHPLYEGCRCKDLCTALKMLWDGMQTALGDTKVMQHAGLVPPGTTHSSNWNLNMAGPPGELPARAASTKATNGLARKMEGMGMAQV